MAIISAWIICAIITAAGGFPSDPDNPNYLARTDRELSVLKEAKWFRFPYPGKQNRSRVVLFTVIFSHMSNTLNQILVDKRNHAISQNKNIAISNFWLGFGRKIS